MLIQLDLESETPIYTQLIHQIIEGIASGSLQPGDTLPSVRSLASDIGINLHTVNKAYTHLKQEGFIKIARQKGVIARASEMPVVTEEALIRLQSRLRPIVAEAICRGMSEQQLVSYLSGIYRDIHKTKGAVEHD
jgi:GntR family transcriptional regulator